MEENYDKGWVEKERKKRLKLLYYGYECFANYNTYM